MTEVKIDVADIVDAFRIIEASIDKGAFTAKELMQVMPVYQKLNAFLVDYQKQQEAKTENKQE